MTVQAPHCAMPQPYFVPVRPSASRSTHSNGVPGSTFTDRCCPFTVKVRGAMLASLKAVRQPRGHVALSPCRVDRLLLEVRAEHEDVIDVQREMRIHGPVDLSDRPTTLVVAGHTVTWNDEIARNAVESVLDALPPVETPT